MPDEADAIFERAAELFSLLSAPIRLKIISTLCQGECNASHLLDALGCTQPNLSQHLSLMYRMGVLSKRREGTQIHYRLANDQLAILCRSVCTHIAAAQGESSAPPIPKETL